MSLTRSLTRPLTRKISRADLTQGFGGSFSPFALNPYLLFDARDSMVGTLENPTLDLNPALPETLDVITATRAGVATYTDADGLIATAPANTVRVDQTQGAELTPTKFQHIENTDFSSWSHARTSDTANAAISPDGQNNATYVEQNVGETSAGSIYRFDAAFTGVFTFSVYAKKKEKNFVVLYDSNVGRTYFNLETGTVGTVASGNTANIEDAGNGWFRCSVTFTASSGTVKAFYVGDTDNSLVVTGGGGIYIYGPQLEEGTTASSFVANTTGSPKFITGATFGPRVPMILVEPSSVNLVTYSEDFSDSSWNKADVTVSAAPVAAPDGTMTASHVVSTGSNAHLNALSIGGASTHTQSIWARTVSGAGTCFFNYHGGTPTTVTEQWQRFEVPSNTAHMYAVNFRGTSTLTEIYIWGAQLETGSVATSYIPTSGGNAAARTRAADDLVISGSAFSSFYNQSEGTVYTEFEPRELSISNKTTLDFSNGTGTERILSLAYSSYHVYVVDGGVEQAHLDGGTYTAGAVNRLAFSYKANNIQASVGGGSVVTDTLASIPTLDRLQIGASYANSSQLNGHIKRLIYWPYHSDSL